MLADSMRWAVSCEESPSLEGKGLTVLKENANSELTFLDVDLRGVNLSPIQWDEISSLIDRAKNVFVITSNQIYRLDGFKRVEFLSFDASMPDGYRSTQVWFDGDREDEIWKRVACMMDANHTSIHDVVDAWGYTKGINVYTTSIKSQADVTNIRVPNGERVYLHDVQIKEDGSASGCIVHADKDFSIPSSTVEMFKAIGELNAQ